MNVIGVLTTVLLVVCCHHATTGQTLTDVMAALTDMKTDIGNMKTKIDKIESVVDLSAREHLESAIDDVQFIPSSTCATDQPATSLPSLADVSGVPDGVSGEAKCGLYCRDLAECKGFNHKQTQAQCDLYTASPSGFSATSGCQYYKAVLVLRANPCADKPCLNGGLCSVVVGGQFKCSCPAGWIGNVCEQANPCSINPCKNGGACSVFCTDYKCACTSGWQGKDCADGATTLVLQKSGTNTVFEKTWAEFKVGFGDLGGNYWLGLDRLHDLTSSGQYKLRFDLQSDANKNWYIADYSMFTVGDEASGYIVSVGGYSGNATDNMSGHNAMKFSTKDKDNDLDTNRFCAAEADGGFWWNACCWACINYNPSHWPNLPGGQNLLVSRMTLIRK